MLSDPTSKNGFDTRDGRLAIVREANQGLILEIAGHACVPLATFAEIKTANRIRRLIDCDAWTELALAVIELELPDWKLRRLVFDDGEWHCSLTKHVDLPVEIDETADGRHAILPLAILTAFVHARCLARTPFAATTVPRVQATSREPMCCDNFF